MPRPVKIVYSPAYDIRFYGIELVHPFDARKFSRAWRSLKKRFGQALRQIHLKPNAPLDDAALLKAHTAEYVEALKQSRTVARVLELPFLQKLPYFLLNRAVVRPMRWAAAGTLLGAEQALKGRCVVNLGGGYHHAGPQGGEGFCLISDIGVALGSLRERGLLDAEDRIAIIDLDAHQGNGFERSFMDDSNVSILDMYNADVYPQDRKAMAGIDVDIPLDIYTADAVYLEKLKQALPAFLDTPRPPRLVFYNAGTDIFHSDPLGALKVSREGVLERDRYVFSELDKRDLPFVMLLSGGYTSESYRLIAESVGALLEQHGIHPA